MAVERFSQDHPLWGAYLEHLDRVEMARWVLDPDGHPLPELVFLGMVEEGIVIGHIALRVQDILVPALDRNENEILIGPGGQPLRETFVFTFAVDEPHRHRGHGRALQTAAIALTKALNCFQIRTWVPLDRPINYALNLGMGFAVHPDVKQTPNGVRLGGVYFVKTV
jgi:GNAT superfamily N-acetyltransferase